MFPVIASTTANTAPLLQTVAAVVVMFLCQNSSPSLL